MCHQGLGHNVSQSPRVAGNSVVDYVTLHRIDANSAQPRCRELSGIGGLGLGFIFSGIFL